MNPAVSMHGYKDVCTKLGCILYIAICSPRYMFGPRDEQHTEGKCSSHTGQGGPHIQDNTGMTSPNLRVGE